MQFIEFKECYAAMYFWMSLAINVSTLRDPPLHHRFDTRQGRFLNLLEALESMKQSREPKCSAKALREASN